LDKFFNRSTIAIAKKETPITIEESKEEEGAGINITKSYVFHCQQQQIEL
jgi:hypothetical protein